MALAAGTRLGPYEILGTLGAGGMGEVYKARDSRLDRTVAIKVLRSDISADPDRHARFEREAKTIAGLTHPHICTLHDVGEHDGSLFLVMEHLEGETLADRIEKGPLPIEQTLTIASEIAEALSAAHRQGIVHRDLKPGNVMLTKGGAKLLDFGLAKFRAEAAVRFSGQASVVTSPHRKATTAGVLVGTLPYMAPEQVEGLEVDARTDLWALGCVLYEMLAGERPFQADTPGALVGAILTSEPPPLTLASSIAPALQRLVNRCLAKDGEMRWDSARDIAIELRWLREVSREASVAPAVGWVRRHRVLLVTAAGLLAISALLAVFWIIRTSAPPPPISRLSLDVQPAAELHGGTASSRFTFTNGGSRTAMAWTADGRALVFAGRRDGVRQLFVRRLEAGEAQPLPNTEGAISPALSADGAWVAYWLSRAIRKVPLGGGPAMELARADMPWGLAWDVRGNLYYGQENAPIWQIPRDGPARAVTTLGDGEVMHSLPAPLPDARTLLYTVRKRIWSWGDEEVVAQTLATGERRVVVRDAADARYVATGHLVFLRRGVLFAVPFDPERVEVTGNEVPVLETVAQALTGINNGDVSGAGQFAVSPTGALAWVPGAPVQHAARALVSVDRAGRITRLPAPERTYGGLHASPDGRRLAFSIPDVADVGIWVYDIERAALTPLNRDGEAMWPIWSPDSRHIVFRWLKDGRFHLASQAVDTTDAPRILASGFFFPSSFAPDGRHFVAVSGRRDHGIVMVAHDGEAGVQALIETPNEEAWPELSPDGHWLAYASNHSGRYEVYVRAASTGGPAAPVSVDGGDSPAWHPNGSELFFVSPADASGKHRLMTSVVSPGSPPRFSRPRELFAFDGRALRLDCLPVRCYAVAPDGQRFYATEPHWPAPPPAVTHINIIQNWHEELKAKAPVRRRNALFQ